MSESGRPKNELSEAELARLEEHEMEHGPLSVLRRATDEGTKVLISLRNNRKILARVKAFDRHTNLILTNATEMWTERPVNSAGKRGKPVQRDRFISQLFVRGDGVVLVVAA